MEFHARVYKSAIEHNIIAGIVIFELISVLSFIINPFVLIAPGDLDYFIGAIIGVYFSLRNRKANQVPSNVGMIVGITGGILSAISVSTLASITFIYPTHGLNVNLIVAFTVISLMAAGILGMIVGGVGGLTLNLLINIQSPAQIQQNDEFKPFDI